MRTLLRHLFVITCLVAFYANLNAVPPKKESVSRLEGNLVASYTDQSGATLGLSTRILLQQDGSASGTIKLEDSKGLYTDLRAITWSSDGTYITVEAIAVLVGKQSKDPVPIVVHTLKFQIIASPTFELDSRVFQIDSGGYWLR